MNHVVLKSVRFACTAKSRLRGLLGNRPVAQELVLAPCGDIHTYGMRGPIDVAFVSEEGRVLLSCRNVPAGRRIRCRKASYVVERFSAKDAKWFEEGDEIAWSALISRDEEEGASDEELSCMRCGNV